MDAPLELRADADIHRKDGGWFKARWHFSFDDYYDRKQMGIGALRVFNHDTLVPGAVWPLHPHHDVEGITYVVAGTFEHADDQGNGGRFRAGAVQRMTLGSGAWHSERNASPSAPVEFIQMWILPDTKGLKPSVEQRAYTAKDRTDRWLQILRPVGSEGEGVTVHQDVRMLVSRLSPGKALSHAFSAGRGGYLYLISGAATVNGQALRTGAAATVLGAGDLRISATEASELILVDTPLRPKH